MTTAVRATTLSFLLVGVLAFGLVPIVASAKTKPTIKLTAPSAKSSFAKEGSGIIPIAWSATNVPEDTLVIVELDAKKLAKGSAIGGGTWQQEIAAGESTGSYNWDIEGAGRADAGTYRVRAFLQECVDGDCTQNPFFPGVKKTKTYAKSKWVPITITKSARGESDEAANTIGTAGKGTVGVTLQVNGSAADSFVLDSSATPTFTYYPSGDVQSCTMTGYYEGGKRTDTHGWKNGVKAGEYGRFSFAVVAAYPLKTLQSVEVTCGNALYRATDTARFTVNSSGAEAAYKILTGMSGKTTFKKGTGTKATAESFCSQAINDPEIHKNTRVQCYFDGERFLDQKAFKG